MARFEPQLLPTSVGSLPHTSPEQACELVLRYLPDIPAWPQLPKLSAAETMYIQFCRDFPGSHLVGEKLAINTSRLDMDALLRELLRDYDRQESDHFAMAHETASGLFAFLASPPSSAKFIKGQITGPISCGLSLNDEEGKPVIYHDVLADALAKHLSLKAAWQEKKLASLGYPTMIWLDEPYMSAYGSAFVSLPQEKVVGLIDQVLAGISGIKGVHCCGNTDWPVLLSTSIDVLSFDAYNYVERLSLYPQEMKAFLGRGGVVAWGIVPNDEPNLKGETAASLQDRLEEAMTPFTRKGIPFHQLTRQGLLTPSCGLSSLSIEGAGQALELLAELSQRLRRKYGS
ncbi:MAG: methionine synthase [Chloroflexota bacterium]